MSIKDFMITVAEAENIIQSQQKDFGTETVSFENSLGRILAEDVLADRDLPPCNRVTMDGIAINYTALENGIYTFNRIGTQAAGDAPIEIKNLHECVEIMTGAALPATTNTVIRYEDLTVEGDLITVATSTYKKGQNIHHKGIDKKGGEIVIPSGKNISPAEMGMLASVGKQHVLVRKNPKVLVISTGDELLSVDAIPMPWQIRGSNSYTMKTALQQNGIIPDILHLVDDVVKMETTLKECLHSYDIIILSGGVSMGKYDYLPKVLDKLEVKKLFHKVQQRPGKPFWFGTHMYGSTVFAFPGNPVSAFMCLHRYLLPWLHQSLYEKRQPTLYAMLNADFHFNLLLQYFLQVKLSVSEQGQLLAMPIEGHGSGDFANLIEADAFMELPLEECNFKKGMIFPIWPFKQIV